MAAAPVFASTAKCWMGQATAANTARDGTGTLVTIATAGASGSRIDKVTVVATGTTTAGVVRLFIHDGTNARLLEEIIIPAVTPSTSVPVFMFHRIYGDLNTLQLPTGYSLRAATNNAETFNIIAFGGDF